MLSLSLSRLRRQKGTCEASSSVQCDNCYYQNMDCQHSVLRNSVVYPLPPSCPRGGGHWPVRSIDCQGPSSCRHFGQNIKISGNALSHSVARDTRPGPAAAQTTKCLNPGQMSKLFSGDSFAKKSCVSYTILSTRNNLKFSTTLKSVTLGWRDPPGIKFVTLFLNPSLRHFREDR